MRNDPHERNELSLKQAVRNDPHERNEPLVQFDSSVMGLVTIVSIQTIMVVLNAVRNDPHKRNEHEMNWIWLLQSVRNDPHVLRDFALLSLANFLPDLY